MTRALTSVAVLALALSVAACGGGAEEDGGAAATTAPAADDTLATPAATAMPSDAPSATPSETASATPTPTASASAAATTTAALAEPAAFAQCKACHAVEPGKHGIGPSLAGIWGDKAGAVPGFEFSEAMKDSGLTWNQATLDRFLTDPRGTIPGTKMIFPGLKDAAKRQEVIAYIRSL